MEEGQLGVGMNWDWACIEFTLSPELGEVTAATSFHCLVNKVGTVHVLILHTIKYQSSGKSSDRTNSKWTEDMALWRALSVHRFKFSLDQHKHDDDVPNHQQEHYRCLPSLPQEVQLGQKHGGVEPATRKKNHTLNQTLKQSGLYSKAASELQKPRKTE